MPEKVLYATLDKNKEYIIWDIGSKDCLQSIEFYNIFPNAKIYVFECCENTIDICKKNVENYTDRITFIETHSTTPIVFGANRITGGNLDEPAYNYAEEIDICYINENDYNYLLTKMSMNRIKMLVNNNGIIYNNNCNLEMYCIYHSKFYLRDDNFYFTFFGVNEVYPKKYSKTQTILEYELEKYNPFLQKRGYMETSAYLHVYWNKLYQNKEMVGFSQYDMEHNVKYDNLDKNTIYLLNTGKSIVENYSWNHMMFPGLRNLNFLIESYNKCFCKNYSLTCLNNIAFSLWQTNIYPVKIYEKLCRWLEVLVEEIYPWSNEHPYETHFGSIGGYTERAISMFNAFEIYEGVKYDNLSINHGLGELVKLQYDGKTFINKYCQDVHTRYIENITGNYNNVEFCMFKAQCYLNDICYSCERIFKNKNGLYFKRDDWETHREYGFDIEGEDPRIFILNEEVYVMFICLSPYENQQRCIGITKFDKWEPVFLQIENMTKNGIEKNWAPFVKDNKLFIVYNYDPLVIIHYDFNEEGICKVIFKQNNCNLPINTSNTYLRGGSNLIHYKDGYYIGGCHSRMYKNCFEHYTHIILLDTNNWELVYVSKPVMYYCDIEDELNSHHLMSNSVKRLDTLHNILIDKTPNIIQDPISMYVKNEKFYITINIRDCVSLLYEISFANLFDLKKNGNPIGYFDNFVKETISNI